MAGRTGIVAYVIMKSRNVLVNGLSLLLLVLTGAGCVSMELTSLPEQNGGGKITPTLPSEQGQSPQTADGVWHVVDEGIERMEYFSSDADASVTLYRFQQGLFTWRFANATDPQMIGEWKKQFPSSVFVMNGTYFHEDYSPSGFLSVGGTRVGERQFDLDKSGLIDFSSGVRLVDTSKTKVNLSRITNGGQAYPFFYKDGKKAITKDTGLLARRSFIGTDTDGRVYLGVVTHPISLYELMGVLDEIDWPWHWDQVLNLDGGPSTGFIAETRDRQETVETYFPVPNVIIVERKP